MIKAIIFDLDGVLSDTDNTRFELLKILVQKRGLLLEDNDYKKSIGKKTKIFLNEIFGNKLSPKDLDEIYDERKEAMRRDPAKFITPLPFAVDTCQALYQRGYVLSIASASSVDGIELTLKTLGIRDCFSLIVGSDKVIHSKPNPEIYMSCIQELGLSKEECLAVEDSPIGIQAAKAAGLYCVAVPYTHSSTELLAADEIVADLSLLLKMKIY